MQGKITDFGVPEIFQLIASQKKSGSLQIRGTEKEAIFLFSDGLIVDVQPDRRHPSGMLGTMLVDGGLITAEQLQKMLSGKERGGKKLGEALVEKGMISGEALARYLTLQIKESLFEILMLKEGEYAFESFAVHTPSWMTMPVRADVLMMEGMQYLDEYPLFREKFPPGEFRVSRKRGEKIDPSALSLEEQRIWKTLEFSPDPQRIFRKSCITWFEGIKGLWSLVDRGIVEITAAEEESEAAGRAIGEEIELLRKVGRVRMAAWAVAGLITATWIYTILLSPAATKAFAAWIKFF